MKKEHLAIGAAAAIIVGVAVAMGLFSGERGPVESPSPSASVSVSATPAMTRHVTLSFYNPALDRDSAGNVLCSSKGLVPTAREIPFTKTPIQDTIKLLLATKPTSQEYRELGLVSEFPLKDVTLKAGSVVGGVLTLTFADPDHRTGGGSCFVSILRAQVEATAKQFTQVQSVRFMPEDLFQP